MINFVIDSEEMLKQKIELVSNLIDINTAVKLKTRKTKKVKTKQIPNPIDENYENLNCEIDPLEKESKEFKLVREYLKNTSNGRAIAMIDIFKIKRGNEDETFNPLKLKNKKLLWHGSRFSNFVGILSGGLRIAPPEAPSTGYLFGKGVYLADMAGKSAPYCCTYLSNGIGLFLLCEAALGTPQEQPRPNSEAAKLQKGHHSTFAPGQTYPDPDKSKFLDKDIEIPMGNLLKKDAYMGANEYIVYNTNQIRMRYLVKF